EVLKRFSQEETTYNALLEPVKTRPMRLYANLLISEGYQFKDLDKLKEHNIPLSEIVDTKRDYHILKGVRENIPGYAIRGTRPTEKDRAYGYNVGRLAARSLYEAREALKQDPGYKLIPAVVGIEKTEDPLTTPPRLLEVNYARKGQYVTEIYTDQQLKEMGIWWPEKERYQMTGEEVSSSSPVTYGSSSPVQKFSAPLTQLIRELQKERAMVCSIHSRWEPAIAVTIFGSARIPRQDPYYQIGVDLGKAIYNHGMAIRTGAGPGMMDAPFKGYREARESSGVEKTENNTTQGVRIALPFEQTASSYCEDILTYSHFVHRKLALCENIIGTIVLPGGFGTIDELFESLLRSMPAVLLVKNYWQPIMDAFKEGWARSSLQKNIGRQPLITDSIEEALVYIKSNAQDIGLKPDLNKLRQDNKEIKEGLLRLQSLPPTVTFVGRPVEAYFGLDTAEEIASRLLSSGMAIRTASRDVLFKRLLKITQDNHKLGLLQATVFLPEKDIPLTIEELSLGRNLIVTHDIFNHQVLITENSLGFVFLPGGIGTLNKLFDILCVMQTMKVPRRPIVLIGKEFWQPINDAIVNAALFHSPPLISFGDENLMHIVDTTEQALEILGLRQAASSPVGVPRHQDKETNGFIFNQWNKNPQVLLRGIFGDVKAAGNSIQKKQVEEINSKLSAVKKRILAEQFFREKDFSNLKVEVLLNSYRSATFKEPSRNKPLMQLDWRSFKNLDFLYFETKHELMHRKIKGLYSDINPALTELFILLFINIQGIINLRDRDYYRAEKLIAGYKGIANRKIGLFKFYEEIVSNPEINDPFDFLEKLGIMVAREKAYFPATRAKMEELVFQKGKLNWLKMINAKILVHSLKNNLLEDREIAGEEELQPLTDAFIPFMPYAQDIWHKSEGDNIFFRVKFKDKDGKLKYAYLYLGQEDDLEGVLSKGGKIFNWTYAQWQQRKPDIFYYQYGGTEKERKDYGWKNLVRMPVTKMIKEMNAYNLRTGRRDIENTLTNLFKDLFRELGLEESLLSCKSWLSLQRMIGAKQAPKIFYTIRENYINYYLDMLYPKLLAGEFKVTEQAIKNLELWPVIENPDMRSSLVSWMASKTVRSPPQFYLKAPKISISELLDLLKSPSLLSVSSPIHRIGILTGGGPASGHNEVIASVVEEASKHNLTVIGIRQGWKGLVDEQVLKQSRVLTPAYVLPYRLRGGTIIGTSRTNPYSKKSIEEGLPAILWEN
ncbi:MAG: LOG family protein, partial [Candidatus Omnitrophota bacterium]